MEWNPWYSAKGDPFDRFVAQYDRDVALDYKDSRGGAVLLGAVRNPDPRERAQIAGLLLDDGADASYVSAGDKINALHVLLSNSFKRIDVEYDAPLLKRLIEAGADVNLRSPRFGRPIELLRRLPLPDEESFQLADAFFSSPDIDLEALVRRDPDYSVRDVIERLPDQLPKFKDRAMRYVRERDRADMA